MMNTHMKNNSIYKVPKVKFIFSTFNNLFITDTYIY